MPGTGDAGLPNYLRYDLITMTSSGGTSTFILHSTEDGYSCVDNYKLYGGPLQPFEYLVIEISKKRLTTLAPLLIHDIRAGSNIITLYGFGQDGAQFVATSIKKNSSTWRITAYATTEVIRAYTFRNKTMIAATSAPSTESEYLDASMIGNTPISAIQSLVLPRESSIISALSGLKNPIAHLFCVYREDRNVINTKIYFERSTSVWRAISLCAMILGCNVWVSGNVLYVVDLSLPNSAKAKVLYDMSTGDWPFENIGTIFLNTEGDYPYAPTYQQTQILNNVLGTPNPEQEGRNLIRNQIKVTCNDPNAYTDAAGLALLPANTVISYTPVEDGHARDNTPSQISQSFSRYGVLQHELDASELGRADAQALADNMADKYCDAEQPISFTMREVRFIDHIETIDGVATTVTDALWEPAFTQFARASKIFDYSNDILLSAESNLTPGTIRTEKGALSYWVRNFPEHTTTYTFGEIAPTDFTQGNSIIRTALNSR